jgi:retron-type reverse transcriptase
MIVEEARKRLGKHRETLSHLKSVQRKFQKRTGRMPTLAPVSDPTVWTLNNHFNPVYCIRHRRFIAKGLWRKLKAGTYRPKPALQIGIPKPDGSERLLTIFSIPDTALSKLFNEQLRNRNLNQFSAASYAYRPDKNVLDAIIQMKRTISAEKVFIIQYDFTKYFDTIDHDYIKRMLFKRDSMFLSTHMERNFISNFLSHGFAREKDYRTGKFENRRVGVPQGTSLSLFLANIAAHELDLELEKRNGVFARFADDVVVVTYTYEDAIKAAETFIDHCNRSGIAINRSKSEGIRILSANEREELTAVPSFSFLGHKLSKDAVSLSDRTIARAKARISQIIYRHLLLYPRKHKLFNPVRLDALARDWDMVTCLNEIRRYIYGGMNEGALREFLKGNLKIRRIRGFMSFYCLVDDKEQLSALDGWLVDVLRRAHVERSKLLAALGYHLTPLMKREIVDGSWYAAALKNETRCPSFFLAWRVARKQYTRHGVSGFEPPMYSYA